MIASVWSSVHTLFQAIESPLHQVSYIQGGWTLDLFPRGVGIEFRADLLGALITLVVTGVGLIVVLYSKVPVLRQTPGKEPLLHSFSSSDYWTCWNYTYRRCIQFICTY